MPNIFNAAILLILWYICISTHGALNTAEFLKQRHLRIRRDIILKAHPFLRDQELSDNMKSLYNNFQNVNLKRKKRLGNKRFRKTVLPTNAENKFGNSAQNKMVKKKFNKVNDAIALMDSFNNDELVEWVEKMNEKYRSDGYSYPSAHKFQQNPLEINADTLNIKDKNNYAAYSNSKGLSLKIPLGENSLQEGMQIKRSTLGNPYIEDFNKAQVKRKNAEDITTCNTMVDLHGELKLGESPQRPAVYNVNGLDESCNYPNTPIKIPSNPQLAQNISKAAEETLKKIMLDLAALKQTGPIKEDFPCSVNGSWSSKVAGVRLELCADSKGNLAVNIMDLIPCREKTMLTPEWKIHGLAPFPRMGMIILAAVNERTKHLAAFIGECRTCGETEMISGQWLMSRGCRNCNEQMATHEVFGDVWRREILEKLREERLQQTAPAKTTTTATPAAALNDTKVVAKPKL